MSKVVDGISEDLAKWLSEQPLFFVATAPLAEQGHVNCSPKGGDCFRVLGAQDVAYLDFTGSGAETVAHLRENGRIVLTFCAFQGKPTVVRLHGCGEVSLFGDPAFEAVAALFPPNPGARAVVRVSISRVSTSCGFSVPLMNFQRQRDTLDRWAVTKTPEELVEYRTAKNALSIDGLPAFDAE